MLVGGGGEGKNARPLPRIVARGAGGFEELGHVEARDVGLLAMGGS